MKGTRRSLHRQQDPAWMGQAGDEKEYRMTPTEELRHEAMSLALRLCGVGCDTAEVLACAASIEEYLRHGNTDTGLRVIVRGDGVSASEIRDSLLRLKRRNGGVSLGLS